MADLKEIYNEELISQLTHHVRSSYPDFNKDRFEDTLRLEDWPELTLKERMRRVTVSLYETLPKQYVEALAILRDTAPHFKGLSGILFPDYVEQYGLAHWEESIKALEYFTQYSTSEFAVRPFLLLDQEKMIAQLLAWSEHKNEHVRRLASEGSRPRLPWGKSIPALKSDPSPVLPILEKLMQDESLYVRKSVANNLNDISKTHPHLLRKVADQWYGTHPHTDWIIKHAYRTLLKKGDKQALALFGYENADSIQLHNLTCQPKRIVIGESLEFSFYIHSDRDQKVRIEYAIDFVKARGQRHQKVFKITETNIRKNETKSYTKIQSFKDLTTRKHYKGIHTLSVIINGEVKDSLDFQVC
ncbi:DNA alkylation repair protein [Bacillus subtilis]|uniref:DNA alkylation repair protein n=1 Tax=Bacillus subtilis TaxID=1423 RepID=UPI00165A8102|nr:DNA alkylation repair protein [Bacillus subtilis]MEC1443471.1 DNA alkylation repair protein [Bacillus subtilis]MED2967219.1 DNA alkylation repair protein [Bacillus subtilis]